MSATPTRHGPEAKRPRPRWRSTEQFACSPLNTIRTGGQRRSSGMFRVSGWSQRCSSRHSRPCATISGCLRSGSAQTSEQKKRRRTILFAVQPTPMNRNAADVLSRECQMAKKKREMRGHPTDSIEEILQIIYLEIDGLNKVVQHLESLRRIRASRIRQSGPVARLKQTAG
jgi:hypothetical protein